jgi:1-deoxy-D-xylulose-5-phosphate synthase
VAGGFGSAILEYAHSEDMRVPIKVMGIPDRFIAHGARSKLLEDTGLTSGAVADVVRGIVKVQRLRGVKQPILV